MPRDWLATQRAEAAVDRILDATDELFTRHDAATVGMNEIAVAAGCSRATLYRYFENRDALYTAYMHRESRRLFGALAERLADEDDPHERLVKGMLLALRAVRENPALASWFATAQRPIGGEMAAHSEVIGALVEVFIRSLVSDPDPAGVPRLARWLVRVITSLLIFPGRSDADERDMIEEFVAPIVLPPVFCSTSARSGVTQDSMT